MRLHSHTLLIVALAVTPALGAHAQGGGESPRIGILPWVDGTGAGSRTAGAAAAQRMIDELANTAQLTGVAIDASGIPTSGAIDQARAIALGKEHNAAYVFVGTVVEATTKESSRGGWLPKIKDNQVHVTVRSIEAKTVLDGVLYDVASGARVLTVTTKGTDRDRSYTGRVWSSWGSWDVADDAAFLASPLGKSFMQATREMVKKIGEATSRRAE